MEPGWEILRDIAYIMMYASFIIIVFANVKLLFKLIRSGYILKSPRRLLITTLSIGEILVAISLILVSHGVDGGYFHFFLEFFPSCTEFHIATTYAFSFFPFVYSVSLITLKIELTKRKKLQSYFLTPVRASFSLASIPWVSGLVFITPLNLIGFDPDFKCYAMTQELYFDRKVAIGIVSLICPALTACVVCRVCKVDHSRCDVYGVVSVTETMNTPPPVVETLETPELLDRDDSLRNYLDENSIREDPREQDDAMTVLSSSSKRSSKDSSKRGSTTSIKSVELPRDPLNQPIAGQQQQKQLVTENRNSSAGGNINSNNRLHSVSEGNVPSPRDSSVPSARNSVSSANDSVPSPQIDVPSDDQGVLTPINIKENIEEITKSFVAIVTETPSYLATMANTVVREKQALTIMTTVNMVLILPLAIAYIAAHEKYDALTVKHAADFWVAAMLMSYDLVYLRSIISTIVWSRYTRDVADLKLAGSRKVKFQVESDEVERCEAMRTRRAASKLY